MARGRERFVREAVPIDLRLLGTLESAVVRWASSASTVDGTRAVIGWFVLAMSYASARLDDMVHVLPAAISIDGDVVVLRAWQTKVHRKRHKLVDLSFPVVGLVDESWVQRGLGALRALAPPYYWEGDFAIPWFGLDSVDWTRPSTSATFLKVIRALFTAAVGDDMSFDTHIASLTCHSCRSP